MRRALLYGTRLYYGMHGHARATLELLSRMVDSGINPDDIRFVTVLSACNHAGLVDEGRELFRIMEVNRVKKKEEHYTCMVDLLSRAEHLDEAAEFVQNMSVKAGTNVYGSLLGACRIHNNIQLAEEAAKRLFVLDPYNARHYMILIKMYEDAGRWDDVVRVRMAIREKQVRKPVGCSAIEVDGVLHMLGAGDETHTGQIFMILEKMKKKDMVASWSNHTAQKHPCPDFMFSGDRCAYALFIY